MRLNVRCCCQSNKIFGTLDVLNPEASTFRIVRPFTIEASPPFPPKPLETELLLIREICDFVGVAVERAVYSEDRPLEFWRTVPGFVEGDRV